MPWNESIQYRTALDHAQAVDVSDNGISMTLAQPLPVGSEVEICFFKGTVAIRGKVRNQAPTDDGRFRVGVEFESDQGAVISFFLKN